MKKLLLIIMVVLPLMTSAQKKVFKKNVQDTEQHMTFMNIPIWGNYTDFANKLRGKGFVDGMLVNDTIRVITNDEAFCMTGVFAGYKSNIGLSHTQDGMIYSVVVIFCKSFSTWANLTDFYYKIKDNYVLKYGKVESENEVGSDDVYKITHHGEFDIIRENYFKYQCSFNTKTGIINIAVMNNIGEPCICVLYADKKANIIKKKRESHNIQNDI